MAGTNIIYISLMIVNLFIKILITGTTYNSGFGGIVVKTTMVGFMSLVLIQSIAIILASTNIQISWQ